jgi:predicted DNA-binding WGR domain protein
MFNYQIAQIRTADQMTGRYELINPARNQRKFWEIRAETIGSTNYVRRWGRIGSFGRTEASALSASEVIELVRSKVEKGYRKVQ